jgi:hypothetical protein
MTYKSSDHILLTSLCDCECINLLGSSNQRGVDRPSNNSGSDRIRGDLAGRRFRSATRQGPGHFDFRGSGDSVYRTLRTPHFRFAVHFSMRFVLYSKCSALQSREDQNWTHCDQYNPQVVANPSARCDNPNLEWDCLG